MPVPYPALLGGGILFSAIGFLSIVFMVMVGAISVACGLYYLAEFAEHHISTAGEIIKGAIYVRP